MNVHLVRSDELSVERFEEIIDLLSSFSGPLKFIAKDQPLVFTSLDEEEELDEERFYKQESLMAHEVCYHYMRAKVDWKDLYQDCKLYRNKYNIPGQEMVILLTDVANQHNWFSCMDPNGSNNGFVHTGDWDKFVPGHSKYSIAYITTSLVLQSFMFKNMTELNERVHQHAMGCMNDFCENKRDVILKLRTADICLDCLNHVRKRLSAPLIQQVLNIFEGVRVGLLYSQDFRQTKELSQIHVPMHGYISFPEFGTSVVRLNPLEKTLYLLFLAHPEGIALTHLVDHKDKLIKIYSELNVSGMLAQIHHRINDLVDVNTGSASQKIANIKRKFINSLGRKLAKAYYIEGPNGAPKKILLDRAMVTYK